MKNIREQLFAEARRLIDSGEANGLVFSQESLDAACKLAAEAAERPRSSISTDSPKGRGLTLAAARGTSQTEALRFLSGIK